MITVATEKVHAARKAAGFRSVQAAARATKLNYKTIMRYEGLDEDGPPASPKPETLRALAGAYRVPPRDLVTDPEAWDAYVASLLQPEILPQPEQVPA